jgi:signal transduction histidine kinase
MRYPASPTATIVANIPAANIPATKIAATKIAAIPVWNTAPQTIVPPIDPIAAIQQRLQQLPHQKLETALELAGELLQATGLRIQIRGADPSCLRSHYQMGPQPAAIGDGRTVEQHLLWQQFLETGRVNETGDPSLSSAHSWVINHLTCEFRLRTLASTFQSQELEHVMVLPLRHGEQLVGSLSLWRDRTCPPWALPQVALAQTLSQQLAQTIAQHQQVQASDDIQQTLTRRTHELAQLVTDQQMLAAIVSKIRQSSDLATIFQTTVEEIYQRFQADRVVIYRFNPDWSGEFVAEAVGAQWTPLKIAQWAPDQAGLTRPDHCVVQSFLDAPIADPDNYLAQSQGGVYAQSRAIRTVSDIYTKNFPACYLTVLEQYQCRAYVTAPIYQENRLWGLLAVYQNDAPRSWSDRESALIQQITEPLGIAIQQAELLASSRSQAQELATALHERNQTQAKMLQNEKMSSLGQLTAGLAHEINNPVTFIHSNISHLSHYFHDLLAVIALYQQQQPIVDADVADYLATIDLGFLQNDVPKVLQSMESGTRRISSVMESLTHFTRLHEAGIKPSDLHQGIDSVILILQHQCRPTSDNAGITIERQYGDLPLVECDASLINQVLMNLISNAIAAIKVNNQQSTPAAIASHMQHSGHIVIATSRSHIGDQPTALIRIQDNGTGIPENIQPRIFDPFFTTKDVGQGSGLGLSISHNIIVDTHQGELRYHTTIGTGTTFEIELPIQSAAICPLKPLKPEITGSICA